MKGYFRFLTVVLFLFAVASILLFCLPVGQASHFFWAMIFSTILGLITLYLGKE